MFNMKIPLSVGMLRRVGDWTGIGERLCGYCRRKCWHSGIFGGFV